MGPGPDPAARTCTPPRRTPRRRLARLAVVAAALAVVGLVPTSCTDPADQRWALYFVNASRAAMGLRPLTMDQRLNDTASVWADHLADVCAISHQLPVYLPQGQRWAAENVGRGGDIPAVHRGFMASPSHRDAIMSPRARLAGFGVVRRNCGGYSYVFVVQRFAGCPQGVRDTAC